MHLLLSSFQMSLISLMVTTTSAPVSAPAPARCRVPIKCKAAQRWYLPKKGARQASTKSRQISTLPRVTKPPIIKASGDAGDFHRGLRDHAAPRLTVSGVG
ncbi:hypothetical protein AAFF_G00019420 [Aldrovandia affinis]|uniref:Secreted protein n=1 Tax=Aldrovandia affinis TaxID=143900 RepID=A0AAD7S5M2_9TELE|nr:hypothetical protein AAFF_G00019420 [Aldrovandia affinis]